MCDVVDILDAHELFLHLIEVVDEGAVTGGTEEEGAIGLAERLVVGVYGDGVGGFVLIGEADVVLDAVAFFVGGKDFADGGFEERTVLRRDGDGELAGTIGIPHVLLRLYEVLGDGGAHLPVGVAVELEDALGLAAVAEALLLAEESLEGAFSIGR